jgi:hypothetical protein
MATRALAHFSPPWVTRIGVVIVRRRRWIWIILTLAGLVFAARAVTGSRGELRAGVSNLRRASWVWLVPAIAAECGAFIALARAQRRILHGGGPPAPGRSAPSLCGCCRRNPPAGQARDYVLKPAHAAGSAGAGPPRRLLILAKGQP